MVPVSSVSFPARLAKFTCCALVILGGLFVRTLPAQQVAQRWSFDVGTGVSSGSSSEPINQYFGISASLQLAGKLLTRGSRSLLAGGNFNVHMTFPSNDCLVVRDQDGNFTRGCVRDFPSGGAVGALVGVEQRLQSAASLRLFVGPAIFRQSPKHYRAGLQTRADLAMPARHRVAFVVWGQSGHTTMDTGSRSRVLTFGLGLRVQ